MKTLGKQDTGIVGFSYEVTNQDSSQPRITKKELGRKTSQKIELAHGYNRSSEYPWNWWGYGRSHAYIGDKGPFYSIVGGYTDRTGIDWKRVPKNDYFVKDEEWGVETGDKFLLWEGHSWNRFLNQEGYSYTYIYLIQKEGINNFVGSRIQSTSKDSSQPWIENNVFGEKHGKEFIWGRSYGWSQQYGEGYNHFSFYSDETLNLDNKDAFWGKINEIEQEREAEKRRAEEELARTREDAKTANDAKAKAEGELKNTQTELERMRKQNEFLLKQLEEQQTAQISYPPNPGK